MILSKKCVWILEDDEGCRFVYDQILRIRYKVRFFGALSELEKAFCDKSTTDEPSPDLLIADLRLPDGCFLDLLNGSNPDFKGFLTIPFLIVSSIDDIDALRFCFDEGAVDYLIKPFKKNELIVKTSRALTRAVQVSPLEAPEFADLTQKEQQILALFFKAKDRTLSREEILSKIWQNIKVDSKTVDVHLFNLRKKLAQKGYDIRSIGAQKWTLFDDSSVPSPSARI